MIDLRTLGTLNLRVRDGPELLSVLSQPKRTGLLCYLALAQPRGFHRRDTLLALFWPEADAEHAHGSLRQAVRFLRRSLGDDVVRSRGDDDLAVGEGVLECDAVAFEEALAADEPERALALYRGDLLPGFYVGGAPDLERWLEEERTRLRACAVAAAWALEEACERAGDAGAAAEWARKALALAPDDAGLRRLLQTLERLGDREGALAAYDSWARRLRAEYEIEPSPEARALAVDIHERGRAASVHLTRAARPLQAAQSPPQAAQHAVGTLTAERAPGEPAPPDVPTESPVAARAISRRRRWAVVAAGLTLLGVFGAVGGVALHRQHAAAPSPSGSGSDVASVAVLPFADLSPGQDQAYFADGLTEELITLLGTVPGLRVPGRTSSFYFRGKQLPVKEIARQLGVRHLVEGSVRKVGPDVRVTVQLTDPWTDRQLWSRSLETTGGDVVALEQAVAKEVISSLRLSATTFPARMPRVPEAYDLYLQALYTSEQEWARQTPRGTPMARTLELYRRALDLDPGFAAAWAGLAHAYYRQADFPRAVAAARRALLLDSTLVLARGALAHSLVQAEWRWADAERVLDRGVELAPSQPYAYRARSNLRAALGRFDEAVADQDRAERLEPLGTAFLADRVMLLAELRPMEAVRAFERIPRADSSAWRTSVYSAVAAYVAIGQRVRAESLALSVGDSTDAVIARGDRAQMLARMRVLEARYPGTCLRNPGPQLNLYRALGLTARTLDCMEEHVRTKHRWAYVALRHWGRDSAVAASPRYRRLMQRVGLPLAPPMPAWWAPRPDTAAGSRSISPK